MIIIPKKINKKTKKLIGESHFLTIEKVAPINCYSIDNPITEEEFFRGNADDCLKWIRENDMTICLSGDKDVANDSVEPSPLLFLEFINNTSIVSIEKFFLIDDFERNRLQNMEKGLRMIKEALKLGINY